MYANEPLNLLLGSENKVTILLIDNRENFLLHPICLNLAQTQVAFKQWSQKLSLLGFIVQPQ